MFCSLQRLGCHVIKCCDNFARRRVTPRIHVCVCVCVISFTSTFTFNFQEFFSARDEPDPDVTPVAGDAVKSPNPKYSGPVVLQC